MEFPLSLCELHRNKLGQKNFSFKELQLAIGKVRHFADCIFGLGMLEVKIYRYFRHQSILFSQTGQIDFIFFIFFDIHIYHGVILIPKQLLAFRVKCRRQR